MHYCVVMPAVLDGHLYRFAVPAVRDSIFGRGITVTSSRGHAELMNRASATAAAMALRVDSHALLVGKFTNGTGGSTAIMTTLAMRHLDQP